MNYSQEETQAAFSQLNEKAKPSGAVLGSVIGAFPSFGLWYFFAKGGSMPILLMLLPPFIIGFTAQFVGRTYKTSHRIPVGIIAALLHLFCCYFYQVNVLIYLLTPVAFGIACVTAKVKLNRLEAWAVSCAEHGKLNATD